MQKFVLAILALGLVACDRGPILRDPGKDFKAPIVTPPRPTRLDGAYKIGNWEWQLQPEGNYLLKHKFVPNCHISVDWPMEILNVDTKPKLVESEKKFGDTTYNVIAVHYPDGLSEVHYVRNGKDSIQVSIFGTNSCVTEAEQIVRKSEELRDAK